MNYWFRYKLQGSCFIKIIISTSLHLFGLIYHVLSHMLWIWLCSLFRLKHFYYVLVKQKLLLCFRLSSFSLTKMIMFPLVLPRAHRVFTHMFKTHIHCTWTSNIIIVIYWELHVEATLCFFDPKKDYISTLGKCISISRQRSGTRPNENTLLQTTQKLFWHSRWKLHQHPTSSSLHELS